MSMAQPYLKQLCTEASDGVIFYTNLISPLNSSGANPIKLLLP